VSDLLEVENRYQLLPPLTGDERESLRQSIETFGVLQPVVIDEDGRIIDGHHRAELAAELGRPCPTTTVAGLSEEQKLETALVLNLGRRHLSAEQKRDLVVGLRQRGLSVRWISEHTGIPKSTVGRQIAGVPSGTPERIQGRDGKVYEAVHRTPLQLEYERIRQVVEEVGRDWLGLSVQEVRQEWAEVAYPLCLQVAARELLRTGKHPDPPRWIVVPMGPHPHSQGPMRRGIKEVQSWDRRVEVAAGGFLNWCEAAGITIKQNRWVFADRLTYPGLTDDELAAIDGDEHNAALGHFWFWVHDRSEP
jgi:hypothetical protein